MNIRKIARWFGLKWSNRLEKLLPRFEHDLLVLSNRTINNSQVSFDDKIHALDNMRTQFENPKYYEGLLRVYATYQLFERMTESLLEMESKKLPISEHIRDLITEFALVRPVNPENKEAARELATTFMKVSIHPMPFATETGERNVSLQAYIQFHRPCSTEDWTKLSGHLAVSEQYPVLVDLYDYLKLNSTHFSGEIYERALRAALMCDLVDKGLEIAKHAFNQNKFLSSTQLVALSKKLNSENRRVLSKHVDITKYKNPHPALAKLVLRHQDENLTSSEVFDAIKNIPERPGVRTDKYAILLEGLASRADVKGAEALWAEMLRIKAYPSNKSYYCLMQVYLAAGLPDEVFKVWHASIHKLPNRAFSEIEVVLEAASIKGIQELHDKWEEIKLYDYRLNSQSYHCYIKQLSLLGDFETAVKIFSHDLCHLRILEPDETTRHFLLNEIEKSELDPELKSTYSEKIQEAVQHLRQAKIQPKFS